MGKENDTTIVEVPPNARKKSYVDTRRQCIEEEEVDKKETQEGQLSVMNQTKGKKI